MNSLLFKKDLGQNIFILKKYFTHVFVRSAFEIYMNGMTEVKAYFCDKGFQVSV